MKPIIVANWKANKTIEETKEFSTQIKSEATNWEAVEVVICPTFTSIQTLKQELTGTSIKIGSQTVSNFNEGAYTGEVTARMLSPFVTHCIVGHSERRKYFGENDTMVGEKVERLLEQGIVPILCISDLNQMDSYIQSSPTFIQNSEKMIFVYEPPSAISGGGDLHPETPESASENAGKIQEKVGKNMITLYGGSVSPADVALFVEQKNLQGVLVGKASLSPEDFLGLVKNITP